MRVIVIFLLLFSSYGFANSTLLVKSGWQLIGLNLSVDDMKLFKSKNVEQVWYFDAKTQKWLGYSPDKLIQKKIVDRGFDKVESLKNWHGFWIKSKQEWMLSIENQDTDVVLKDNNISLEKGWNLISLPIDSAISPEAFDDVSIWKYSQNRWRFFGKNEKNRDFPAISHISNSDGIWVKSEKKQTLSISKNSSLLHSFENMEQVKAYIKDMILVKDRPYFGYHPILERNGEASFDDTTSVTLKTEDGNGISNTTGTNLQESDVDESDILKHDGKNIFYVDGQNINVTTFSRILSGEKKPLKIMALDASRNVNSLYLVDDKLVVLSSMNNYIMDTKSRLSMPYPAGKTKMSVDTYSVGDITNIEKIGSFVIDGSIKDSRVIDGKLVLISTFNPNIEKKYPKIYVDAPECKKFFYEDYYTKMDSRCYSLINDNGRFYRYDYENPIIVSENLIPMVVKDEEEKVSLLIPTTFYVPSKKDQEYSITTVSKIDIKNMELEDTSSILGYQSAVYASSKALYLVSDKYPLYYDFQNYKHRSAIYKFQISDKLTYKGMGFVDGSVLNQFSLSEYDDVLRIATTEGNSWGGGGTKNSIFTLREKDGVLEPLGYLGGLGKKDERIYSVRFMGKKGYVVTFMETDPFYTIDLSDPANPLEIGALEIEGFSSYLHPIGDDLIMGVGRDADNKLKLELFDISTFSQPESINMYVFNTSGYFYSELERNHKALAFRGSDNLFAIPFSGGDYRLNNYSNYLGVFKVENNKFKVYNNIVDDFSSNRYSSLNRGIIFDKDEETYIAYLVNGLATFRKLKDLEKKE